MTPDEYVLSVISKYRPATGPGSPAYLAGQRLSPIIRAWANGFLIRVSYSGSYAKGTSITGSTDVDLFISLLPEAPGTLRDIYDSLYFCLTKKNFPVRRQNVSIGLTYLGVKVDLTPGRKQPGNTDDHSLFKNKSNTWTQTNVQTHINKIQQSGRLNEIRVLKIWRNLNQLDFPSFYLELTVLDALYGKHGNRPAANVWTALEYFRDKLGTALVVDPANSNNTISDDLSAKEKARISNMAANSLRSTNWSQIIW